jgi:rhodanese-related sulfurtransferase
MVAASILKQKGFINVKNVWGGYAKIKEEQIDLVVPAN